MSDHQVKVLEHARRELERVAGHESPHLLPLYQKFLKDRELSAPSASPGRWRWPGSVREPRFVNRRSLASHFFLRERRGDGKNEGESRPGQPRCVGWLRSRRTQSVERRGCHVSACAHRQRAARLARTDGRADSLFSLGHRLQSRPLHPLGARGRGPGQRRDADENRHAGSAISHRRLRSLSNVSARNFAASACRGT